MIGFQSGRVLRALSVIAVASVVALAGGRGVYAQSAGAPAVVSAEDDKAFVVDFLEKGYLQAWFAHPSSVRQHFSDPLEVYWNRRDVPLKEVVQEKLGYARKWIFRFYRLNRESVRLEPVAGKAYGWRVTFQYDFIADSAPPRSEGVGETTLLLEVIGDQVKIHGESGRVVERK